METVNILSGGIAVLRDDIERLSNESIRQSQWIKETDGRLETIKVSCEESGSFLSAINMNMSVLQQDFQSLKHQVEQSQSISYDGSLIWKITDVQEKISI